METSISVGRRKATRYRPGLWGDAVRVKKADTSAWGLVMMTERKSSNTSGLSLTWEQKRTFVTSLIEKDNVARRTVSYCARI